MIRTILSLCFASLLFTAQAQQDELLLKVLNDQVDAFNQQDVDRLVDNVTADFKWFYITSDALLPELQGKEKFRASMVDYYKSFANIKSSILNYTTDGNRISFQEKVEYTDEQGNRKSSTAMGIYEIRDGKIARCWYFF